MKNNICKLLVFLLIILCTVSTVSAKDCTITFDRNGHGTLNPDKVQKTVPCGKIIKESDTPSASDFSNTEERAFLGWDWNYNNTVSSNITLKAKWQNDFTVTFVVTAPSSSSTPKAQTVKFNGTVIKPSPDPTASGKRFLGWVDQDDHLWNFSSDVVKKNLILTTEWDAAHGLDLYDEDGTTLLKTISGLFAADNILDMVNSSYTPPEKAGKLFYGWSKLVNACKDEDMIGSSQKLEKITQIYACYISSNVTVKFDKQNGTTPVKVLVPMGDTVSASDPGTLTDSIFGGWFTDASCTDKWDFAEQVWENMTLYAKWIKQTSEDFGCGALTDVIDKNDCLALQAIYNANGGSQWTDSTNWGTSNFPWTGVKINKKRVISLKLPDNQLVGTLPGEIGNLTKLEVLDLSGNELSGKIPQVKSLVQTELWLGGNSGLVLTSPDAIWGYSKKYTALDLNGVIINQNYTFIGGVSELGSLEYLDLSGTGLQGEVAESIGTLSCLKYLYMSNNDLSGTFPLIDLVTTASGMVALDLSGNSSLVGSIPEGIENYWTSIESLNLNGTSFSGFLPSGLSQMTTLEVFDIGNTAITGNFDEDQFCTYIKPLSNMYYLDLSSSKISGRITTTCVSGSMQPDTFYASPSNICLDGGSAKSWYEGLNNYDILQPCDGTTKTVDENEPDPKKAYSDAAHDNPDYSDYKPLVAKEMQDYRVDDYGGYYYSSKGKEYAYFWTKKICRQFLSNPDLCTWPRVVLYDWD